MAETQLVRRYGAMKLSFKGFPLVGSEGLRAHSEGLMSASDTDPLQSRADAADGGARSAMSNLSKVKHLGCLGGGARRTELRFHHQLLGSQLPTAFRDAVAS